MRILVAGLLAASLIAPNVFAATTDAPLPAGKAAGVKTAQDDDDTILYVLGGGAVIAGIVILATNDNDSTVVTGATTAT